MWYGSFHKILERINSEWNNWRAKLWTEHLLPTCFLLWLPNVWRLTGSLIFPRLFPHCYYYDQDTSSASYGGFQIRNLKIILCGHLHFKQRALIHPSVWNLRQMWVQLLIDMKLTGKVYESTALLLGEWTGVWKAPNEVSRLFGPITIN